MTTDTERLEWLEKQDGAGLISDDNGHWAVSTTGVQKVIEGGSPINLETLFLVFREEWRDTVREAIDAAMSGETGI
jgi:hypothetical protein